MKGSRRMDAAALQHAAIPIFLFVLLAVGLGVAMLVAGRLVGPQRQGAVKAMPYESGMDPIHHTRRRFDIRFHLVAIAFLVFDVELLFLYPWAVATRPMQSAHTQPAEVNLTPSPIAPTAGIQAVTNPPPLSGIDGAVERGEVSSRKLVFGSAVVFIGLLTVGLVYDWRKGVFQWR